MARIDVTEFEDGRFVAEMNVVLGHEAEFSIVRMDMFGYGDSPRAAVDDLKENCERAIAAFHRPRPSATIRAIYSGGDDLPA